MEPMGQGLWVVPGIFWFMTSCKDPGGAGTGGSGQPTCKDPSWCPTGTQCDTSPSWLIGKRRRGLRCPSAPPALCFTFGITMENSRCQSRMTAPPTSRQDAALLGVGPGGARHPRLQSGPTVKLWIVIDVCDSIEALVGQWHWSDRPTMQPPSFRRGAVSLGTEIQQWFMWIGGNISAAHGGPAPPPPGPPVMYRCISNKCVNSTISGVPQADCEKDCGPGADDDDW